MTHEPPKVVTIAPKKGATDPRSRDVRAAVEHHVGRAVGARSIRLLSMSRDIPDDVLLAFASRTVADPIVDEVTVARAVGASGEGTYVHLAKLPGTTDDEARSAEAMLALTLAEPVPTWTFFTEELVVLDEPLPDATLAELARDVLGNPNVHTLSWGKLPFSPRRPAETSLHAEARVETVALPDDDAGLAELSTSRALGLSLAEMHAIRDHFTSEEVRRDRAAHGLPTEPTDCELEIFAQTWSEHCKHKELAADVIVEDHERGERRTVRSLFKTCVVGPTREVVAKLDARGQSFVVTVFDDNAGIVRVDPETNLTLKVETHNSPSALDPYGGAITGILGCNRDAVGTGRGGGRLFFNTDVLCFGPPSYAEPLLPGQLHPARIFEGVHAGVRDGGNKSGVPTVNGALVFDDRFSGKPLVFCGSSALVPALANGAPAHTKDVTPGCRIVTVGGRVGMDGIHGATFSSHELKSGQSRGVVQVGSPFTQKLVVDLLEEAAALGLVAGVNDSGAGGLSSSAGELARITGGAVIDTSRVPLKYPGLVPWQIFLSESQERMTLAIRPSDLEAFMALAARRGVEAADIGEFTSSGKLEVVHGRTNVARLDLTFLHDGVPKLSLEATVTPPRRTSSLPYDGELGALLLRALAHPNVASREAVVRAYDHEVKGKTVLKPYMGKRGKAPQDAGCMLVRHGAHEGIAVSSGIVPRYGDLDAYAMAQSAFDEAVRALVSIGARLPQDASGPFEPFAGCDNFCVPDSVFHPERNPDGREKLGKLVRISEGLADMVRAFEIPMISGKDSMKNDFRSGGRKISVPPTLLITMVAKVRDVRRLVTSEWKAEGDVVYLLGETYDELGRSIVAELGGDLGGTAPRVRIPETLALYGRMARAHDAGLFASSHDLSDGGLAVGLAESCIGSVLGAELHLPDTGLDAYAALFSESNARFVVSVRPSDTDALEALFGDRATRLGHVRGERLHVSAKSGTLVDLPVSSLADAYETRLS